MEAFRFLPLVARAIDYSILVNCSYSKEWNTMLPSKVTVLILVLLSCSSAGEFCRFPLWCIFSLWWYASDGFLGHPHAAELHLKKEKMVN
ncbi:hypothetical protein L1887_42139 [Cichorium endivia]|nr:hypothetical protein L1887_42139 [Cichorium endivia]